MLLIVEKDARFTAKLKDHLQVDGLRNFFVESCQDAAFLLESIKAKVIVLNLNSIGNWQNIDNILEQGAKRRIPVIFIVGQQIESMVARVKARGGEHFVRLPFRISELKEKIKEVRSDVDPMIGVKIGPPGQEVEVIKCLGKGAMGTVYEACQRSLDRRVAVKLLSPSYQKADPDALARFEREARAIAQIRSTHIVQVFFIGEFQDQAYTVMEFIDGPTLEKYLKTKRILSVKEALRLVKQVLEGLAAAHAAGKIHRDIKPANIMINHQGEAIILDFGLVRAESATGMTQMGTVLGTPRYISPEQVRGRGIDHRADIYSVGIMLYEMLLGQAPFDGKDFLQVMMKHVNDPLPVPETLGGAVAPELWQLILGLTAKRPEDRISQAREAITRIERLLLDLALPEETMALAAGEVQLDATLEPMAGVALSETGTPIRKFGTVSEDHLQSMQLLGHLVDQLGEIGDLGEFQRGRLELEKGGMVIFPYHAGIAMVESSSAGATDRFENIPLQQLSRLFQEG